MTSEDLAPPIGGGTGSDVTRRHLLTCATMFVAGFCCDSGAAGRQRKPDDWDAERARMVREQIEACDIRRQAVLDAMRKVPRHLFVPESDRARAYADSPLPIGYGQTISQPYIVGFMTQALSVEPSHRVLEIGTGSGYQAAVLGLLAQQVYTMEIRSAVVLRRAPQPSGEETPDLAHPTRDG